MNPMDAMMLAMESPETPMHVGGVQVFRKPRGAGRDYVRKLRDGLMKIPASGAPFNYRYKASGRIPGVPAWQVLEEVDLREHVFHHALPWPGTDKELFELVARLNSGPLDRSKPLWEHHLIEGLAGNRFATFTRIHHSIIDGSWGMKLYRETTSSDANARGLPPYWGVKMDEKPAAEPRKGRQRGSEPAPGWLAQGRAGLSEGAAAVSELGTALGRVLESFVSPSDDGLVPMYTAPSSMLNGKVTARREIHVTRISLPRLKRLAAANDATINDIVLAACAGGLRRYLMERRALPKAPLIANMVVAVRRAGGARGGNAIAAGLVSLATHVADPAKRLATVRSSSRHAKELIHGLASTAALNVYNGLTGLPFALFALAGQADKSHAQNVVISNVVGLREKRYANGALIESDYPMSVLVPGQATNITVISRLKMLEVAVLVCPDVVPESQSIGAAIADAVGELEQATARKSARRARRSPAGRTGRRSSGRSR
jgi:WS/DGAT/MGAT family acyltransferase